MIRMFRPNVAWLVLGAVISVGCDNGPPRYDVSGTITFDGKPVPTGYIVLNADHQSGNKGPQGRIDIRDGKIAIRDGMGTVGGSQWLQISGFDGKAFQGQEGIVSMGKDLFPMAHKQVDLPLRDVVLEIQVSPPKAGTLEPEVDVKILD